MGWSCSKFADETVNLWSVACRASTGAANTWKEGNYQYFWEISQKEHEDGAITGAIWRMLKGPTLTTNPEGFCCIRAGSFRINGDGSVKTAPKFLKLAAQGCAPAQTAKGSTGINV